MKRNELNDLIADLNKIAGTSADHEAGAIQKAMDVISHFVYLRGYDPKDPSTTLWRGECGHCWSKSYQENCPYCELKELKTISV